LRLWPIAWAVVSFTTFQIQNLERSRISGAPLRAAPRPGNETPNR
jgi:hypothetical protein